MEPITIALGLASLTGLDKKIGRWLGGDNGERVASQVMSIAQQVTGAKTPEQMEQVLREDRQALMAFEERLLDREEELERLAYQDRSDARKMQAAALAQDDSFSKRFIYFFAAFWSLSAVLYICLITFMPIPEGSVRFADTILGFLLGTVIATIIGFFFGSSSGSQRKGEQLAAVVHQMSAPAAGTGPSQGDGP